MNFPSPNSAPAVKIVPPRRRERPSEPIKGVPNGLKSSFKGVCWSTAAQLWICQIKIKGKQCYLGTFESEEDAARKYDEQAAKIGRRQNFNAEGELQGHADEAPPPRRKILPEDRKVGLKSAHRGVSWNVAMQKWQARLKYNGKDQYLGCFDSEEDAAKKFAEASAIIPPTRRAEAPKCDPQCPKSFLPSSSAPSSTAATSSSS